MPPPPNISYEKEEQINPLVDLPGNNNATNKSQVSIPLEEYEHPFSEHYKLFGELGEGEYFRFLCNSKCYRFIRESFLVSSHPRIHRGGYRSHYAMLQERARHLTSSPWIIHPFSTFRWGWEIVVTLALMITLVRTPIVMAYLSVTLSTRHELIWSGFFSVLFCFDIILNFRTGIVGKYIDEVELDPEEIAKNYASTWFIVDVVSTIPYEALFAIFREFRNNGNEEPPYVKYIRFLELLNVLRLSRVIRYLTRFQKAYEISNVYIRLINLNVIIVMTLHWLSCLHYFVADIFNYGIKPPKTNSWVTRMDLWHEKVSIKYINSLMRALSSMACLGFGNEVPREPEDIVTTITSVVIGVTLFALFVGTVTSVLINLDAAQKKYAKVLNEVMEYMKFKQIPKYLQKRVVVYYEERYRGSFFNETTILENMSDVLRQELQMFTCRKLVVTVPLFEGCPQGVIQGIVSRLKYEVYLPQDVIINANIESDCMYFIEHGTVQVLGPSGKVLADLKDGDFFGEMALVTRQASKRHATIAATSFCGMYKLSKDDFEEVLMQYPNVYRKVVSIALKRFEELDKDPKDDLSMNKNKVTPLPVIAKNKNSRTKKKKCVNVNLCKRGKKADTSNDYDDEI